MTDGIVVYGILMSLDFFFHGTVTGESYLNMLGDCLMAAFDKLGACLKWCMQYGAPQHYALSIHHCPNGHFTDRQSVKVECWNGHQDHQT
jgi:hypothetical protein